MCWRAAGGEGTEGEEGGTLESSLDREPRTYQAPTRLSTASSVALEVYGTKFLYKK